MLRFAGATRLSILFAGIVCVGCKSDGESLRHRGTAPVATLVGEVRLAGVQLPQYADIDLVRTPLLTGGHAAPPSECTAANAAARTPVQRTEAGLLSGIVVAASDFTRMPSYATSKHQVAIEHCRLQPALVAATAGDTLALENRDEYPFEPLLSPAYTATPLAPGKRVELSLGPTLDALQCSVGAPCGRTDLLVFQHPVHAITNALGHFRLDNVPAQELVRITAWHPLFEPSESFVWLEPGQQSSIVLELMPKARFLSAAAAP